MAEFKNQEERWNALKEKIMEAYAHMQQEFTKDLIPNFEAKPMDWRDLKPGMIVPIPVKRKDLMIPCVVEETQYSVVHPMQELDEDTRKVLEKNNFVDGPIGSLDVKLSNGYKMMIRWDIDPDIDRKLQPDYQFFDAEGHVVISPMYDGWLPNGWKTEDELEEDKKILREDGVSEEDIQKHIEYYKKQPKNSWLFWLNAAFPEDSEDLDGKHRCMWIVTKEEDTVKEEEVA